MDHTCYKHQRVTKSLRRTRPIASPAARPKREGSEGSSGGRLVRNRSGVEGEGKTSVPNQRRRTQVACARCRRRKIKCSGDLGNGEACANCKLSGTVNSSPLQTKSGILPCLYHLPSSTPSGTYGQQQAAYDAHVHRASPFSMHAGSTGLPAYSAVQPGPAFDFGTAPEPMPSNRASHYLPNYPLGYGDEPAYHIPLSHILPSSTGAGVNAIYGTTAPKSGRLQTTLAPANGGVYSGPDGNGLLSPSFPFLGRSSSKCTSSETFTLFPIMSSLSSGQDRTLPNPTSARSNTLTSIVGGNSATSPPTVCSSITAAYKQTYHLAADNDSTRPMAGNDTSSSFPANVKVSSSPVDCGFGYMPLSNSLQTCVTSAPFLVNEAVDAPVDFHQGTSEQRANKKVAKGKGPADTCVSEYGHSTTLSYRPGPTRPSGGMLVSGEVYQRPQYTTPARNLYPVEKVTVPPHLSAGTSSCY